MALAVVLLIFGFLLSTSFAQLPPFLQSEFERSLTAYGPGLAVFSPFSYVDMFYDNLPFIGKIPPFGKEGTSSRTGVSPFYPAEGNPSNPFPPLYKARPLPIHAPDPVEVVAVPLDEEALHGEPLFPKELVLPWEMENAGDDELENEGNGKAVKNPFGDDDEAELDSPPSSQNTLDTFPLIADKKITATVNDSSVEYIDEESAEYEDAPTKPQKPKLAGDKKIPSDSVEYVDETSAEYVDESRKLTAMAKKSRAARLRFAQNLFQLRQR